MPHASAVWYSGSPLQLDFGESLFIGKPVSEALLERVQPTGLLALYSLALACWLPVVWLQLRMRDMLAAKLGGETIDEARLRRYFSWWFVLGWPAFIAFIAIFFLMVVKPAVE